VTNRARLLVYGSILALFVLAGLARLLIDGFGAEVASLTVMSLCLGAIVLLVFYEVGLSEDKARAEEEAARRERSAGPVHQEPQPPGPRRRPG
jgi:hypothetical protein